MAYKPDINDLTDDERLFLLVLKRHRHRKPDVLRIRRSLSNLGVDCGWDWKHTVAVADGLADIGLLTHANNAVTLTEEGAEFVKSLRTETVVTKERARLRDTALQVRQRQETDTDTDSEGLRPSSYLTPSGLDGPRIVRRGSQKKCKAVGQFTGMDLARRFKAKVEVRNSQQQGWVRIGETNLNALAGSFARWRREDGLTPEFMVAMIDLFAEDPRLIQPGVPAWKTFLAKRQVLAERVLAVEEVDDYTATSDQPVEQDYTTPSWEVDHID